ncbi:MAG: hypothetical protein Q4G70_15335 [Pseudomonadota bacterium]|nr:hypothetical protein [Pseudomonadota bacterium]
MSIRRTRVSINRERWNASSTPAEGSVFENVDFDELIIQNTVLRRISFVNCRFKHCRFGFNARYEDCVWESCKFTSQHTSFGPTGTFERCIFTRCLIQSCSVDGASFNNCSIGGTFKHLTIRGEQARDPEVVCRFTNCDLSQTTLSDTCFILGVELDSVNLPATGIRLFNNQDERLRLELLAAARISDHKKVSSALECLIPADGQRLVVLDPDYMNSMLDTQESLRVFNEIAPRHEISRGTLVNTSLPHYL